VSIIRTWLSLFRATWTRTLLGSVFVWLLVVLYPAAWTKAEEAAITNGYVAGIVARVTDPAFWKKAVIGVLAVAVLQEVVGLIGYYLGLLTSSERNRR